MKTIGLLGGMSWESTALYYRLLNEGINHRLGRLHSAKIVLVSVDFEPIEILQREGDWEQAGILLAEAGKEIEAGGADFLLICTNTMHKVASAVQQAISIPLLHLADATAEKIRSKNIQTVGLLGTKFTMEEDFYKGRLTDKYGLQVIVPEAKERQSVHRIIFEELCHGRIEKDSKEEYLRIIKKLRADGAEAVIAGCTEIGMLVNQSHTDVPIFDTTVIHVEKAIEYALTANIKVFTSLS